ncbi:tRNA uridine-5-carboxymethylaminomethyl(34) synthesis GTPase MnmE [Halodurantibacterium flavum]|uniref:tRNA modification GTPase MnmE n=1 Tax=Halodurantibacterium flavum TaxID=1382802 RepID=A0ABW4S875_9RHOB
MDTIFALASARGKAGVAVVRISGPRAWDAVAAFDISLPEPRRAGLRRLRDSGGDILDEALVLLFEAGRSFTGEQSAELHLHGSVAVIGAVLRRLAEMPDVRAAEPGEFTRRALENERLDLSQVEGLADLVEAETEAQRRQALRVLSGALGERADDWRRRLIRAAALVEATIDFADEDVPVDVSPEVLDIIDSLTAEFAREIAGASVAERIREGFEVAILGRPNSGKSTLLNALAGRDAAITSDIAGTTRDVIEVRMDLGGLPVTILDTAGLRESDDRIERIGIERAIERAARADLRVLLLDEAGDLPVAPEADDILVHGKADLFPGLGLRVSGKTGEGLPELITRITDTLSARASSSGVVMRERQRQALVVAMEALESARDQIVRGTDRAELAAADLRRAVHGLNMMVGHVDVEHVLDEIFSSFCIGK